MAAPITSSCIQQKGSENLAVKVVAKPNRGTMTMFLTLNAELGPAVTSATPHALPLFPVSFTMAISPGFFFLHRLASAKTLIFGLALSNCYTSGYYEKKEKKNTSPSPHEYIKHQACVATHTLLHYTTFARRCSICTLSSRP